jgi:superfamily II DNA or RNA helicase
MITLRPYQSRLIDDIRLGMRRASRDGRTASECIVSPTGSGKTAIFASIAQGAASKKNRVMTLVHRREIMEQTLKAYFRLGVTSGQIAAGKPVTQDSIQTAMVGTLVRRLGDVRRPDLIIVDECHHALEDNSWGKILRYWSDVPRLGFTATPERLDGRGLGETFGHLILGPSISDLVIDGWLAAPALYRPPHESDAQYHVTRGDFDIGEQAHAMSKRQIVGDVIEHYREHLDRLPVVVFCVSIEHSRLMAAQFERAGYVSRVVWGNMPRVDREAALKGLADGSVHVVCSCDVISEGVDVPVMAGAILLRRTQSLALYLQQSGRALRPIWPEGFDPAAATADERIRAMARAGKPRAVILDHAGNYALHGHVLADRSWTLDARPRSDRQEKPPTTTTCPACYGVWPGTPRKCPACGFVFGASVARDEEEIKVVAGRLVEAGLDGGEAAKVAEVYSRAMQAGGAERQRILLGAAFKAADKRAIDQIAKLAGYNPRWSHWAWEYVQGKRRGESA